MSQTALLSVLMAGPRLAACGLALCLLAGAPALAGEAGIVSSEPFESAFSLDDVDKPGGLAYDGRLIWVADRVRMALVGLDPATGEEADRLESPGPWPTGLAWDGRHLWVADRTTERLYGIDLQRRLTVREVPAPSGSQGMAFDGRYLWVADGKELHQVTVEDGTTIVSHRAPAWDGEGRGSDTLGLAFREGALWVSDRLRDRIYRVDAETGMVTDMLPSPGPFPSGLAFVEGGRLLIADVDGRRVDDIDVDRLAGTTVRGEARGERVEFRRRIVNRGPGELVEAHVYLALPVDGANQDLHGEPAITPEPLEIVEDRWGQRFAHVKVENLAAGESLDVTMSASATLYEVREHFDPARVGSLDEIPAEVRAYLEDASKFAIDHPSIRRHLEDALAGETHPYWMVRRIAKYIQDRMHYELVGGWNIAPTVIDRGSGSCSEYTFVFIAMCRAAGIPARYAGAIVVRGDDASTDEVFHRWAEIYLPGYGWVTYDVQAGDKPQPERQAEVLGGLSNRFLITTRGGGDSEIIGWDYNSTAHWICRGRCLVDDVHIGDWYPAVPAGARP